MTRTKIAITVLIISIAIVLLIPTSNWDLIKKAKSFLSKTSSNKPKALIEPEELNELIKRDDFNENYKIIETFFGPESLNEFNKDHIPNALYFDTMKGVEPSKLFPRGMPKEDLFKDYVSSLGISNKHHLIIYDRSDFGFFTSSRAWFIFRLFGHEDVSILSGGLRAWKLKSFPTTDKISKFAREDFKTKFNKDLLRSFEEVVENISSKKELLVDAREKDEFEKIDAASGKINNIPNSVNAPYSELFDEHTRTIKDKQKLLTLFKEQGVDIEKPLIASCTTGVKSSTLAFMGFLLGLEKIPVYSGSWTEFSQRTQS